MKKWYVIIKTQVGRFLYPLTVGTLDQVSEEDVAKLAFKSFVDEVGYMRSSASFLVQDTTGQPARLPKKVLENAGFILTQLDEPMK